MRYAIAPIAIICLLVLVGYIFTPPLRTVPPEELQKYAASQFLSEPALAGQLAFENKCSDCHGSNGGGSENAPSLLDRSYAADFRNVEVFHSSVVRDIPEHIAVLGDPGAKGALDFNKREFLAKYLREMRLFLAKEAREG